MAGRVPAPLVFVASAFSQYLGAGLAVSLFSLMPSTSILVGAVVLGQLPSGWKVAGLVLVSPASCWCQWPLPWPARTAALARATAPRVPLRHVGLPRAGVPDM